MKQKGGIFGKLLLAFTLIPVVEVFLLVKLAGIINWFWTIVIVIATGVIGAYMAKNEGRGILTRIQSDLSEGKIPKDDLINGLCVLVGGIFLVTPGILTDFTGFSLIFPATRNIYKKFLKDKFKTMTLNTNSSFVYAEIKDEDR